MNVQDSAISSCLEMEERRKVVEASIINGLRRSMARAMRVTIEQDRAINTEQRRLQEQLQREANLASSEDLLLVCEEAYHMIDCEKLTKVQTMQREAEVHLNNVTRFDNEAREQNFAAKQRQEQILALLEEESTLQSQLRERNIDVFDGSRPQTN